MNFAIKFRNVISQSDFATRFRNEISHCKFAIVHAISVSQVEILICIPMLAHVTMTRERYFDRITGITLWNQTEDSSNVKNLTAVYKKNSLSMHNQRNFNEGIFNFFLLSYKIPFVLRFANNEILKQIF